MIAALALMATITLEGTAGNAKAAAEIAGEWFSLEDARLSSP